MPTHFLTSNWNVTSLWGLPSSSWAWLCASSEDDHWWRMSKLGFSGLLPSSAALRLPLTYSCHLQRLLWHTHSRLSVYLEPHSLSRRGSADRLPSCLMPVIPRGLSSWYPGWCWAVIPFLIWVVYCILGIVLNALHGFLQSFFNNNAKILSNQNVYINLQQYIYFPKTWHILIYLILIITLQIVTIVTFILWMVKLSLKDLSRHIDWW